MWFDWIFTKPEVVKETTEKPWGTEWFIQCCGLTLTGEEFYFHRKTTNCAFVLREKARESVDQAYERNRCGAI